MNLSAVRPISPEERSIIDRLLKPQFPGRDEILAQIKESQVCQIDKDGSLRFFPPSTPYATVLERVPVEGSALDEDGYRINLLLHVNKGFIVELEIYKDDGSPIKKMPAPDQIEVVTFPPCPPGFF